MNTPISFRLRKEIDADLILAVSNMDQKNITELCRNGLRLMLGIRTTRQTQIVERRIEPAGVSAKIGSNPQGKPFMPKGRVGE